MTIPSPRASGTNGAQPGKIGLSICWALLFGQPARSFFASELIRLTGSGSGAVQRELKRLVSSGLVTVNRIGRQKHFQANPDCPVFDELCAMVRKTVAMVEPIRQALKLLAERIALALIYGSVAKGAHTASSDIDLLVVADELTLEALYSVLVPVETNLARKISPTLYTTKEFESRRAARNPFLTRVLEGEHLVLIGKLKLEPPARYTVEDYAAIEEFRNLPQTLADAGYYAGLVGKYHLGRHEKPQLGFQWWTTFRGGHTSSFIDAQIFDNGETYNVLDRDEHLTDFFTNQRAANYPNGIYTR